MRANIVKSEVRRAASSETEFNASKATTKIVKCEPVRSEARGWRKLARRKKASIFVAGQTC